jgi:hypothetical protein
VIFIVSRWAEEGRGRIFPEAVAEILPRYRFHNERETLPLIIELGGFNNGYVFGSLETSCSKLRGFQN